MVDKAWVHKDHAKKRQQKVHDLLKMTNTTYVTGHFYCDFFKIKNHRMLKGKCHKDITVWGSLHYRRILCGRNFVRVRNVVVAAIFDFMTVEDWGE